MNRPPERSGPLVLFVCTGNIFRSAIAAAHARRLAVPGIRIGGAGTHASDGDTPTPDVLAAAAEIGLDLSTHRATRLTAGVLGGAGRIYCMEPMHLGVIGRLDPAALERTLLLDPGGATIDDVVGFDPDGYRRVRDLVVAAVEARLGEFDRP